MPVFRRRYLVVAIVAVLAAGIAIPVALRWEPSPEEPFFVVRLLTWNVGLRQGPGAGDTRAESTSLDVIAQTIIDADADAVVLQEIRSASQLDVLLAALGGAYTGGISERERTDRAIVILVRGVGTFRKVPSEAGRPKIAATFDAEPRRDVTVVGVHLSAFDPNRRRREALELLRFLRERQERVLLAGDFNLDPSEDAAGVTDRGTYELLTRELRDLGTPAGATALLGRRIDYVFARPDEVVEARPRIVAGRREGRMDHEPLLVHVGLRKRMP